MLSKFFGFGAKSSNISQDIWAQLDNELGMLTSPLHDLGQPVNLYTIDREDNQVIFHMTKDGSNFDVAMRVSEAHSFMGKCPKLPPVDDNNTTIKLSLGLASAIPDCPPHITEGQEALYSYLSNRIENFTPEAQKEELTI